MNWARKIIESFKKKASPAPASPAFKPLARPKEKATIPQTDFKKQTAWISPGWKLKRLKSGHPARRMLTNQIPKGWKKLSVKGQESAWKERKNNPNPFPGGKNRGWERKGCRG